jgi:hypothetical protein
MEPFSDRFDFAILVGGRRYKVMGRDENALVFVKAGEEAIGCTTPC